ncbi:MAG TPA: DUF2975 domain-containing protein [Aliiroseovarius sp.]|nr:DUF2975 domain-containing protein [Aliiroseovarius sp.]
MIMPYRIARLSFSLQWLCRGALVVLPASMVGIAILTFRDPATISDYLTGITLLGVPSPGLLGLVLLLAFIPQAAALYVLWQLEGLFGLYRRGETLTAAPARRIRAIGHGVVALALLPLVIRPLAGMALSFANPPGARQLNVSLSSGDVGLLLAGGLLVVIGWIMGEAVRIAEENRGFV